MENQPIEIGSKIEMVRVGNNQNQAVKPRRFVSQLLDMIESNRAKIAMPMKGNTVIPLRIGDIYELHFFTGKGLFQCKAEIKDRYKENNIYILEVEYITFISRYQRREYYRLECFTPLKYRVMSEEEMLYQKKLKNMDFKDEEEKLQWEEKIKLIRENWKEGAAIDLSGGGIKISAQERCKSGDLIDIDLPLIIAGEEKQVSGRIKVIDVYFSNNERPEFIIRGSFQKILGSSREHIINYVFQEQKKRLQKG